MRVRKLIIRSLLIVAALVLLATGGLYLLASWQPANYRPAQLSQRDKERSAYEFATRLMEVNNRLGECRPFEFTVSEAQVNAYLASIDEINALQLERGDGPRRRGQVYKAMASWGLSAPAVAFRDGVLTLMVRSDEYNKVISAGLSFQFLDGGEMMRVRLEGVHVGRWPVWEWVYRAYVEKLKAGVQVKNERAGNGAKGKVGFSSEQVLDMALGLLSSIDDTPIPTELRLRKWLVVRLEGIELADGQMTLRINPIRRVAD